MQSSVCLSAFLPACTNWMTSVTVKSCPSLTLGWSYLLAPMFFCENKTKPSPITQYYILGNPGAIHSLPTAFMNAVGMEWITPGLRNAVGTEWIMPGLRNAVGTKWITVRIRNAVGTEWITPGLRGCQYYKHSLTLYL